VSEQFLGGTNEAVTVPLNDTEYDSNWYWYMEYS